jgi:hypothetical protein
LDGHLSADERRPLVHAGQPEVTVADERAQVLGILHPEAQSIVLNQYFQP